MKCTLLDLPNGGRAVLCGSRRYVVQKCGCGNAATKLCDWIAERRQPQMFGIAVSAIKTCDTPLCDECTTSPAEGKDLCVKHAEMWAGDARNPQRSLPL